jgi:hypothetical protein
VPGVTLPGCMALIYSPRLAFLSFSHALPPYGRVVRFQTLDVRMTRFRTMGKAVERPMPLGRPGGK